MANSFLWLGESGIPRKGPALTKGAVHAARNYPAAVVEEWIKTGAAESIEDNGGGNDDKDTAKDKPVKPKKNGDKSLGGK